MSPWTDLRGTAPALSVDPDLDPVITAADLAFCAARYLGSFRADDPGPSPQLADLRGLPPLLVLVGEREILLRDALGFVAAAAAADVEVELVVEPGMFHVWPLFADLPEAGTAIDTIRSFTDAVVR